VAIDRPNIVLEAELLPSGAEDGTLKVEGLEAERVAACARRFRERYPSGAPARLCLKGGIPPHVGLGSGTQLALAVGAVLARLGAVTVGPPALAQAMGRGTHSGVGIAAFQGGGFILDGGHALAGADHKAPPVLVQCAFPEAWRWVVVVPGAPPGISGAYEERAFRTLPPAPQGLVEQVCRRLVMQLLPALVEQDIVAFGEALTAIQQLVGDSFAAIQGGRFANTLSSDLIAYLLAHGAHGAGQSSWGPAVYALARDDRHGAGLLEAAQDYLASAGRGEAHLARAANHGAQIRVLDPVT
jgi:beta-RFAP synthase